MPIQAFTSVGQVARVPRRPQHTFQIRCRPWQIVPFMIAPVLPGETLKNLLCQARVVTDPVKSNLIGWWAEYYWFYVKHRDMDGRTDFANMMLDPSTSLAAYNEAANVDFYHAGPSINWTKEAYKRVVASYFRDDGETWNSNTIGNYAVAKAHAHDASWLNSATNEDPFETADPALTVGVDDSFKASEIETLMRQWDLLRMQHLTNQTYEEYLATFGVKMPEAEELHRPELIRYVRDWKYPTNTVDPSSGAARSAVVWSVAERADKDRFFKEPGFILGVCVFRPKIYLQGQKGSAVLAMTDAYKWLPAVMRGNVNHSWVEYAAGAGPLSVTTDGYYFDVKDILHYGDQFVNFALTETDAHLIGLPTAALNKGYPASADADELFVSASPANQIRMDGVVSLNILGTQVDMQP